MQRQIYQEKSQEDRTIFLRDTCDKMEDFKYEKSYTNQDIEMFCTRLSEIMIDVQRLEMELSKIKKEYSEKMKPSKGELNDLLNKIKFRAEMVEEQVYIFIDHEHNEVGYYSKAGVLVHKRMLRIDEHQRSIMGSMRSRQQIMEDDTEDEVVDILEDKEDDYSTLTDEEENREPEYAEVEDERDHKGRFTRKRRI